MATEKRLDLIDRQALGIGRCNPDAFPIENRGYCAGWNGVVNLIEQAPTVDAVEVVHGRWEDMYGGEYANPRYRCSVCKEKANYKSVQDELLTWHDVQALTPYCPYCMAKLDGGKSNDI